MSDALESLASVLRVRNRLGLIALEPRQMYDGAAVSTASLAIKTATAAHVASTAVHGNSALDGGRKEVVFVDGGLTDASSLVSALTAARPGATIAVLDPNGNELQEIASYLQGISNLDAIHIVSHGSVGDVFLGSQVLSDATIAEDQSALTEIGQAVKPDGEILLYGCDVAAGGVGQQFITDLSTATGRVIAASTDDTGAASLGGNWTLEATTGRPSVDAIDAVEYNGLLTGVPAINAVFNSSSTIGSGTDWNTSGNTAYIAAGTSNGTQSDTGASTTSPVSGAELTGNFASEAGSLVYNTAFNANAGLDVKYSYYAGPSTNQYPNTGAFNGYAADGISFFLIDGSTNVNSSNFHVGQPGAALGYSGSSSSLGLTGAILGVGLDEFGNFTVNNGISGSGGRSSSPTSELVGVRGSAANDYAYLGSSSQLTAAQIEGQHTVEVQLSTTEKLTVILDGTTVISNLDVSGQIGSTSTLLFGFSGSTGASWNEHTIESVSVTGAGAPNQPSTPPSNPSNGGTALPTIGGVPTVTLTSQEPVSFSGTSDASVTDTLLDNGTLSGQASATTTADNSGHYSESITLAEGSHQVTVQSFKTVNGVSVPSLQSTATTVDVAIPPVISSIAGVDSASQTVSGTVPDAVDGTTTVSLYDGSTLVASNIAVSGGAWSYTGDLGAGAHSLTATETTGTVTSGSSNTLNTTVAPLPVVITPQPITGTYSVTYDKSGAPVLVDSILTVTETDAFTYTENSIYAGGSLAFSSASANDQLSLPTVGATATTTSGIVSATTDGKIWLGTGSSATQLGTFTGSGTNDLTISFSSSLVTDQVVQSFARQVTFANDASTTPSTPSTISIVVTDGTARTTTATTQVDFIAGNGANEIPILTLSGSSTSVLIDGNGHAVDSGLTVTGSGNIPEAQVFVENYQSGDNLTYNATLATNDGLTTNFNSTTGVLTVTSPTATAAQYQEFLRTVTFSTTSTSTAARTVDIVLGAGLYYSFNGHFYEYVSAGGITFQQAEVDASQSSLYGLQGYLATTTSAGEDAFIAARLQGEGWQGASDRPQAPVLDGSQTAYGHWHWVDGPEGLQISGDGVSGQYFFQQTGGGSTNPNGGAPYNWPNGNLATADGGGYVVNGAYVNWTPGEPNNFDQSGIGGEQYAHFYGPNDAGAPGTWNDYAGNYSQIQGYVVEFGGLPSDPSLQIARTTSISVSALAAPTITGLNSASDTGTTGDRITDKPLPTIVGTGAAGETVTLTEGTTVLGTAVADSSGDWSITVGTSLSDGSHSLTATATLDGATSATSSAVVIGVDTTSPSVAIATAGFTSSATPTITGTAADTGTGASGVASVEVFIDGTDAGAATITGGTWSFAVPSGFNLGHGTHSVTAEATDVAGNSATSSAATLTYDHAPTLSASTGTDIVNSGSTSTVTLSENGSPTPFALTLTGSDIDGDALTYSVSSGNGPSHGTASVDANGTVHYTPTANYFGTDSFQVTVSDGLGGTATRTVDLLVAPAAPTVTGITAATDTGTIGDGITSDTSQTVIGMGEVGTTITLYAGMTQIGMATVDGTGHYSIATTLAAGTHSLTATETDTAGTTGPASSAFSLTIDTSTPAAPTVTGITAATDTGTVGDDITSDTTPTVTGTGDAGTTIDLYDGSTLIGTGTVDGTGHYSIATTLAAGAHSLTATETNAAGTTGPASSAFSLTIDTSTPAAPTVTGITAATDTGTVGDGITSDTTPTVTGTGDAGTTIKLYDGSTLLGTATVDGTGHYSIATSLAAGTHSLTATETNTAGTTGTASSAFSLTIDTHTPAAPTVTGITAATDTGTVGDRITSDTTPTVTGTGEVGTKIKLYDGSTLIGTGTVDSSGHYSIATSTLTPGTHSLTATETDTAGTTGPASSAFSLMIDTSTPAAPTVTGITAATDSGTVGDGVTSDTTPTVTGTGNAGTTINLYEGGTLIGTGTVDSTGHYSIAISLAAGSYSLTATETNTAGTTGPASTAFSLTIDTGTPSAPTVTGITAATDTGTLGDGITSDTTPTVIGTGEVGTTIKLYDGTTLVGTGTVDSTGHYAIVTTLTNGTHPLTATVTDAAGTTGPASSPFSLTIDTHTPAAPTVTGITAATDTGTLGDGITRDTTPTVTGTGEPGTTVSLFDGTTLIGTGTIDSTGHYSIATTLTAGAHALTATATDAAGTTGPASSAFSLTIDTHTPTAPTITGITAASDTGTVGDGITSDAAPTVTGTGEVGTTVSLFAGSTLIGTATVDSTGHYSITTPALSDGTHRLTATETDAAGTASPASSAFSLTIDTHTPAAPTVTGITAASDTGTVGDGITSDTTPTVTGTGEPGTTVSLFDGTTLIGTATVDGTGHYSIATTLTAGTHALTATATDAAGTTGPASSAFSLTIDTHTPAAPTITGITAATDTGTVGDGITSDATPTVTGTGEVGTTVSLFAGTTLIGTATVDSTGHYSITTPALSDGTHPLTVTETDAAGTTGPASSAFSLTIDTHTPAAPTIAGITATTDTGTLGDGITSDTTPTVTGTGEPGTTVSLFDGTTLIGAGTVDSTGHYSIATTLTAGTHALTATVTDTAGTNGPASSPFSLTIDTHTPAAPTVTGITAATDTGTLGDGITSDTTPTVTGTGEPGTTVSLFDGTTLIGTATVGSTGHYSIATPTLTDGTHALTATVTDKAGTTGPASSAFSLTIDTHTPAAPTVTGITAATDTGTVGDGITSDATPTVTGTGEPGTTVSLFDGTRLIGTGTVDSTGHYSIATPTLTAGTHTLTATVADKAGTTGPASAAFSLTIDTHTPAAPTIGGLADGTDTSTTSDRSPALAGTAEAGSTITVYDGTAVLGTAVVDASGHWSFTPSQPLADGLHVLTITATDAAGVTGAHSAPFNLSIAPSVASEIPSQSVTGGSALNFTVPVGTFTLPAGDTPTYSAQLVTASGAPAGDLPSWLMLNPATGSITGSVPIGVSGVFHIQLTVSDGHGGTTTATFDLSYQGPPPPVPVVAAIPTVTPSVTTPSPVQTASPVLATVVRDNTPTVSSSTAQNLVAVTAPGVPDVLVLTSQAAGGFQVGVAASSGSGSGADALVTVKPLTDIAVPEAAQVNYNIGVDTFNATNPQAIIHLTATLADGEPLPGWLAFDPRTGSLSGEPPQHQIGLLDVLITARDTEGHEAVAHVKIELGSKAVQPQGANTAGNRHADAGIRHVHIADATDADGMPSVLPRDPKLDQGRASANQSLSAQIKSAHTGRRLLQQASLFRTADQMLRRA